MKYAKLINENQIEYPPKNKGNIINYNLNIGALKADGYKEFIEAKKEIGKSYNITYFETETQIIEQAIEIIPAPEELLEEAKALKIQENDTARDEALISGVVYKEVLFDSDTDQKANILGAVLQMSDTSTIEWFGMNNYSLACTKEDLLNIGGLITQLHSYCWTENARIKNAINEAQTIEEVNSIVIDYNGGIE
jgi:hypothetical protein